MNISSQDLSPYLQDNRQPSQDSDQQGMDDLIMLQGDIERIKPFVSLNIFTAQDIANENKPGFTSASGKAIITYIVSGEAAYSDSTGKRGTLKQDGWSWIIAGSGICYSIAAATSDFIAIQLGIALSPALENSPPQSAYLDPLPRMQDDPVQVLIGWHEKSRSKFAIPSQVNYFVVHLKAQQRWRYELPLNHKFAWVSVVSGRLKTASADILPNALTLFTRATEKMQFHALEDSILVIGSSMEFGYELIFQQDSVHTSSEALHQGLKGIAEAKRTMHTN